MTAILALVAFNLWVWYEALLLQKVWVGGSFLLWFVFSSGIMGALGDNSAFIKSGEIKSLNDF